MHTLKAHFVSQNLTEISYFLRNFYKKKTSMIFYITKGFKLPCIISFFFYLTVLHHVKVFFDFEGFVDAFGFRSVGVMLRVKQK